jgi:hypothetical protein
LEVPYSEDFSSYKEQKSSLYREVPVFLTHSKVIKIKHNTPMNFNTVPQSDFARSKKDNLCTPSTSGGISGAISVLGLFKSTATITMITIMGI